MVPPDDYAKLQKQIRKLEQENDILKKAIAMLIIKALENAYHKQEPGENQIFHSDPGTQYTSDDFKDWIDKYQLMHSFSHKGSPYEQCLYRVISRHFKERRSQSCSIH